MIMVDIKICGISTLEDYVTCSSAGARWVGMVHYPKSSRHLDCLALAKLTETIKQLPIGGPQRVLLTVDQYIDTLRPLVKAAVPDFLQLHGRETTAWAKAIKSEFGLPIIKMVPVATNSDLENCAEWDGIVDWLIFDAKTEQGLQPGGTGHSFDWAALSSYQGATPWMLAGGLTEATVSRAIKITGARAVDVSSGVEDAPGQKNKNRIHAFISMAQIG